MSYQGLIKEKSRTSLSGIFSPFRLGNMRLSGRIIHSAIADPLCDLDHPRPDYRYAELTKNGVSLITISIKQPFRKPGDPETITLLSRITQTIHKNNGHAVLQARPDPGNAQSITSWAKSAQDAGFDGVELRITDKYFKNHMNGLFKGPDRAAQKILSQCLEQFNQNKDHPLPVIYKLLIPPTSGGLLLIRKTRELFEKHSHLRPRAFHVTTGLKPRKMFEVRPGNLVRFPSFSASYYQAIKDLKHSLATDMIIGGGFYDPLVMDKLLKDQVTDLIALGRPLVREPGVLLSIKKKIRHRFLCNFCNGCVTPFPVPPLCPSRHSGC